MKITKVELENVKCFKHEIISFEKEDTGEPLSVCALVGANGSGKSAVLKAIVAAFSCFGGKYGGELFTDEAIYYSAEQLQTCIEIQLNDLEKGMLDADDNFFEVYYEHGKENQDTMFFSKNMSEHIITNQQEESTEALQKYVKMLSILLNQEQTGMIMYYDPFRFVSDKNPAGPNIQQQDDAKMHALASNIGMHGENLYRDVELKQWLVNMDYIRLKEPSERNNAIYNHMIKAFSMLMHPLKFETINQNGELIFTDQSKDEQITVDMLSDGFKSIFSIVLDIIRRMAMTPDVDGTEFYEKEAVVLIDEVDCHIHPKWQRKIMPALRELFPNCQFIITTHSPYVLEGLQEYEIKKIGEKNII